MIEEERMGEKEKILRTLVVYIYCGKSYQGLLGCIIGKCEVVVASHSGNCSCWDAELSSEISRCLRKHADTIAIVCESHEYNIFYQYRPSGCSDGLDGGVGSIRVARAMSRREVDISLGPKG
jgi:hypothetical protein